jgi:microcystin-dependent protein
MAGKALVPQVDGGNDLGTAAKKWRKAYVQEIQADNLGTAAFVDTTDLALADAGVTGGNTHAHHDGDGGQIDHVDLANKGTNTHAQIDSHLSSTSNPHNTTASQVGIVDASFSARGIIQLATLAEAATGTDPDKAVTPAGLGAAYALKTYVDQAIAALIDGAPAALDTLNELAAALGDDANYAATITTALGLKAPINNPSFTGTVTLPGAPAADLQASTKKYVDDAVGGIVGENAGMVKWFAANSAPSGYLKANGSLISRVTYSALFAVIGTTFGGASVTDKSRITAPTITFPWGTYSGAANINDNNPATYWVANTSTGSSFTAIQYDLGTAKLLSKVYSANIFWSVADTVTLTLEYSVDNSNWYSFGSNYQFAITNNASNVTCSAGSSGITARYIRLRVTGFGQNGYLNVGDFNVWEGEDTGTTFALPDIRGEFVRGWDDARGIDSARTFASSQTDAFQGHIHQLYGRTVTWSGSGDYMLGSIQTPEASLPADRMRGPLAYGTSGTPRTAAETRPRNVALLACIKY